MECMSAHGRMGRMAGKKPSFHAVQAPQAIRGCADVTHSLSSDLPHLRVPN
jgi:hypothetical protein